MCINLCSSVQLNFIADLYRQDCLWLHYYNTKSAWFWNSMGVCTQHWDSKFVIANQYNHRYSPVYIRKDLHCCRRRSWTCSTGTAGVPNAATPSHTHQLHALTQVPYCCCISYFDVAHVCWLYPLQLALVVFVYKQLIIVGWWFRSVAIYIISAHIIWDLRTV